MAQALATHRGSLTRQVDSRGLAPLRCSGRVEGHRCGKLLAYAALKLGSIEIKCPRCSYVNMFVPDK